MAIVLYDSANIFFDRDSNFETGGGGLRANFTQLHLEVSVNVSVPNFNVTDCNMNMHSNPAWVHTGLGRIAKIL